MCGNDMIYGGYYQSIPNNMMQYNYGYQGMPINPMNNMPNMMNNYQNPNIIDLNGNTGNPIQELNSRINNLENRVQLLEQRIGNTDSFKDDNSLYMI